MTDFWCNKLFRIAHVKLKVKAAQSDSVRPQGLYSPWNSPGQNPGVGSFSLLQGIFPNQGLNPRLPHCRWILPAEPQGRPKDTGMHSPFLLQDIFLTQKSNCIAGRFFTNWSIREAFKNPNQPLRSGCRRGRDREESVTHFTANNCWNKNLLLEIFYPLLLWCYWIWFPFF